MPSSTSQRFAALRICLVLGLGGLVFPAFTSAKAEEAFRFREGGEWRLTVGLPALRLLEQSAEPEWIPATLPSRPTLPLAVGRRVLLQLADPTRLAAMLQGRSLKVVRTLPQGLLILEGPRIRSALEDAQWLAEQEGVLLCRPILKLPRKRSGSYAPPPRDPYFTRQWHLENRNPDTGSRTGIDLNVRAAWPESRGRGVVIAVADDGIDMEHPDLREAVQGMPHYSFITGTTNGGHSSSLQEHGTAVAGLVAARGDNDIGGSGVAPDAKLVSWVIFGLGDAIASEELLMDMFQTSSNLVSVQNHSWGNSDITQLAPTVVEQIGLSNAVNWGRQGLGVVMVRAGGNGRTATTFEPGGANANDDGYLADPRVIAVAAARSDGRAASYSTPGACLLVGAPSGDEAGGYPTLFTTDPVGLRGANLGSYTNDLADYGFDATGFSGTSGATPQISGLAALILGARPDLGFRDVQQIVLLSARHFDLTDPDLTTNGAGLVVSHNVGFGIPDAGEALRLAKPWPMRPALTTLRFERSGTNAVPDAGLRLLISGSNIPPALASLPAVPSAGPHADEPTSVLPLVYAGQATNRLAQDLRGRAALIQRGGSFFRDKIFVAAEAGAEFAIIFNHAGEELVRMADTDYVPIPAVFIGQSPGEALSGLLSTNETVRAQLVCDAYTATFIVTNTLICEHVEVLVDSDHPRRGDQRIVVISPQGTRSVLQKLNQDVEAGPVRWTYLSTHHFYESSAGAWRVQVTDQQPGLAGNLLTVALTIHGVSIVDEDRDGLEDAWERRYFGSLAPQPRDDPDGDGVANAREQVYGTDPAQPDRALSLDLSTWNRQLLRLSWPGQVGVNYEVLTGSRIGDGFPAVTNVAGTFPETEWFSAKEAKPGSFYTVRRVATPLAPQLVRP